MIVGLLLLGAALHGASILRTDSAGSVLRTVLHRSWSDTMQLDFVFAGTRPSRERIGRAPGADGARELWIEFVGARIDSGGADGRPGWLRMRSRRKSDTIAMRVPLTDETPWMALWHGDTLRLRLLDHVRTRPAWANPWVLGGAGVALVGGGVALWSLLGSDADGGAAAPADDVIPLPEVAMPQ